MEEGKSVGRHLEKLRIGDGFIKHYGDICKIDGSLVEPVEVVVGGSPCQDLSIAGKRAGLAGERSGLFMEQIRIIKEMRENAIRRGRTDTDVFPRFMVWENVPGALSSNHGEDFRAVLEETIRIVDKNAAIPKYEGGSWRPSGVILGDGFSVAWRVHDAQFWGVPQRRRRIALVADFGGGTAPEILFEREGVPGDSEPGGEAREGIAADASGCAYPAIAGTLRARANGSPCPDRGSGAQIVVQSALNPWDSQTARIFSADGVYHTLSSREKSGLDLSGVLAFKLGNGERARGIGLEEELAPTLSAECGGNKPAVLAFAQNQRDDVRDLGDCAGSLAAEPGMKQQTYVLQGNCIDRADTAGCGGKGWSDEDVCYTLNTIDRPAVFDARGNGDGDTVPTLTGDHENRITDYTAVCVGGDSEIVPTMVSNIYKGTGNTQDGMSVLYRSVVRRLTPLECTRLQDFPDGWVDLGEWVDEKGKKHKEADAPKYKALGNSIALPFWHWLLKRISDHCEEKTMGSLFDGIGGFPLCWQMINGDGSCRWSSEIEPFCIAVTTRHFGDEEKGIKGDWMDCVRNTGIEAEA